MNPSLYIHIPVCLKKCDYCDFFSIPRSSFPHGNKNWDELLVKQLGFEAEQWSSEYDISEWKTVYIGGGTPSLLSPHAIYSLCDAIKKCQKDRLQNPVEWTIEANPEDLTEEWITACTDAGINRLSLGIQTLQDECLSAVSRRGSRKKTIDALELISGQWKGRLSLDFIAGLPGQTEVSLLKDLHETISSFVDHVSLYSLTVEENTPLAKRLSGNAPPVLPDDDIAADMWIAGRDFLEQQGFYQYEISNFCRPGCESLHNMTYWNLESYIGVGPGATGTIVEGDSAVRFTNTTHIERWLEDPAADRATEHIGRLDSIRERLLMGMRLSSGISKKQFKNRFGTDILSIIPETARKWQNRELLVADSKHIALTRGGLLFLNKFLSDCMEELCSR